MTGQTPPPNVLAFTPRPPESAQHQETVSESPCSAFRFGHTNLARVGQSPGLCSWLRGSPAWPRCPAPALRYLEGSVLASRAGLSYYLCEAQPARLLEQTPTMLLSHFTRRGLPRGRLRSTPVGSPRAYSLPRVFSELVLNYC